MKNKIEITEEAQKHIASLIENDKSDYLAVINKNALWIKDIVNDSSVLKKQGVETVAIMSNDTKNYPDDSFDKMIEFSKINKFEFPYLIDQTQEVARKYSAVCTPDFFGYNSKLELQYRGRIRELKDLKPVDTGDSDLLNAMRLIVKTGKGPKNQIPSMGCNIKWFK